LTQLSRARIALLEVAVRNVSETSGRHANLSDEVFSWIQAPMGAMVLPFAKVPRQTLEEEAGAGGVTAQAGRMQQCTAQGSPGQVGGTHRRWGLRPFPTWSASRSSVFIMRVSFGCCVSGVTREEQYAPVWPLPMGCSPHVEAQASQPQHPARLAEVVAVDGESDGQRKMGGAAEEGPQKQAPVMESFATKNAETNIGMEERHDISPVQ
jgi:hypothetical protein